MIPSFYAGGTTCPARPAEHLLEVCAHVQGQTLMQPCAPAPAAPIDGQHVELADFKSRCPRSRSPRAVTTTS